MTEEKRRSRRFEILTGCLVTVLLAIGSALMFLDGELAKGSMGTMATLALVGILVYQHFSSVRFPPFFMIIVYVFTFVSVGLGTLGGFYHILHFDDVLHFLSGLMIGYGSFILLKLMLGDLETILPKAFIALYMISFALAAAGLWELFEFAGDKWFHFTAQGRDHDDTMFDMINGLTGGILATILLLRKR